jgi:hypothetical protein
MPDSPVVGKIEFASAQQCISVGTDLDGSWNRMKLALEKIASTPGCECDSYEGHRCLMCDVRKIALAGLLGG